MVHGSSIMEWLQHLSQPARRQPVSPSACQPGSVENHGAVRIIRSSSAEYAHTHTRNTLGKKTQLRIRVRQKT
jgi:hypothetical protein